MNIVEEVVGKVPDMFDLLNPFLLLDMAVKSVLLFSFIWIISRFVERRIRFDIKFDRNQVFKTTDNRDYSKTPINTILAEVATQIAITTVIIFLFKATFHWICGRFDFLPQELSDISWGAATLYIPFSLFNMSKNLGDKLNYIAGKYKTLFE